MEGKQISTNQFVVIQFLIALAVKMFMLPALMLRIIGKDSFFVLIFWITVEFLNLTFLLLTARRNPDKTMYDILTDAFGKVAARIIVALFSLFVVLKGVLVMSEIKLFFSVTMYDEINWNIMVIPLLALMCAFGVRSLRALGRTAQLIVPIVLISTLVLAGLLIGDMQCHKLLPFLEHGLKPLGEGIITFPMWFGDITFLLIFLGNIKITKGFMWATYLSKFLAAVLVMVFSTTLFAAYGHTSTLIDYGNNVSNMTQFSLGSQDYGRFDLLFYCIWLFTVFFKLAVIFYFLTRNIGFIVGSRNNYVISIITAVAFYIIGQFFLKNNNLVYTFCTGPAKYVVCPMAMLLPLLLYVISLIKYKPNYHSPEGLMIGKEKKSGSKKSQKQSAAE